MMKLYVFVCICMLFVQVWCNEKEKPTTLEEVLTTAKSLARKYHDPKRAERVNKIFSRSAGVYHNKTKSKHTRLEKTVLINVVESSGHRWNPTGQDKYKQLVHNHICYTKLHQYETIVYIVDDNSTRFDSESKELRTLDPLVRILDYPYELFWSLVAKKTAPVKHQSSNVDYGGTMPSFKHFGFLVMLVPLLEALQAGYNVIYFDVDIALLKDPLPFMVHGSADVTVSMEKRTCVYPSLAENKAVTDWNDVEPNTGTLFAASNNQTIALFKKWMNIIVQDNTNNDQKALNFKGLGAIQTFDCNTPAEAIYDINNMNDDNIVKYCFLNELLFQNGKLAFACAFDRHGSRLEYLLGLAAMQSAYLSTQLVNTSLKLNKAKEKLLPLDTFSIIPQLRKSSKLNPYLDYLPVTVHANYCDNKKSVLGNHGLWLAEGFDSTSQCKELNISNTFFGKIDWDSESFRIGQDLQNIRAMSNNTVFKFVHRPSVYLYNKEKHEIRPFGSGEKFLQMGYEWKDVKNIKTQYSYFMNFTIGQPI